MYSQEGEQKIITDYLGDSTGTLLSIGENDGEILSNARQLILNGWNGVLVEPSKAFMKLQELYKDNPGIECHKVAIGVVTAMVPFYESCQHLTENDTGLISTLDPKEIRKWKGSRFDNFFPTEVMCYLWDDFYTSKCLGRKFDFITIDAEGMDVKIVEQMDLNQLGCKIICVEHNSVPERRSWFEHYMSKYGLTLLGVTYHNLIFAR